jgi:RNA polymerase sigma-70 factor (ECF subfamily)
MTLSKDQLWACRDAAKAVAYNVLKHDADAEDIAQNVLVKMWQKYHNFQGSSDNLLRIAKRFATNESIDVLRANNRRQAQQLELDLTGDGDESIADSADIASLDSPDDVLEAEEQRAAIQKAINDLPITQVVAYFMAGDGRTFEEIAEHLKTTTANARQLVSRANSELRWVAENY